MSIEKLYEPVRVSGWEQLIEIQNCLIDTGKQWIFRGQRESSWGLQPTLERTIASFNAVPKKGGSESERRLYEEKLRTALNAGVGGRNAHELECGLFRSFKRQADHFVNNPPEKQNIKEWFALMQHHGTPTRLLDWTYSFFIAVYFAIESAESECAVWALNSDWIDDKVKQVLRNEGTMDVLDALTDDNDVNNPCTFKLVFYREQPVPLVGVLTPYRLNERLAIQQGTFMCQGDISKPFEDNLKALCQIRPEFQRNFKKYEIRSDLETRKKILQHLHRMNINEAVLFPGLDGFARSLRTLLVSPKFLAPDPDCETTKPRNLSS